MLATLANCLLIVALNYELLQLKKNMLMKLFENPQKKLLKIH